MKTTTVKKEEIKKMDFLNNIKDNTDAVTWEAVAEQIKDGAEGKKIEFFKLYENLRKLGADFGTARDITEIIIKSYYKRVYNG